MKSDGRKTASRGPRRRDHDDDEHENGTPNWPEDDPRWGPYWRRLGSYFPAGSEERQVLNL